jgi:carbon-monoxide dehydrogenase large subunit
MFDSAEIRVHPTGSAIIRLGVQTQGQGHETTFAQIVAEELGIPAANVKVEEGDTDTAPYGLGTYGSRSTPTAGAAAAIAARKIREKARLIAAHLLECAPEDLEWTNGKWSVKGSPDRFKTIQEIAFAAYTNHPQGMEAGLEATDYYDPPNLTFPFGSYICVVDIDKGTGQVKVRRFVAVDDCGNIINPMIVDGQIHGGLAMGLAPALYEEIPYDEQGNNLPGRSWTTSCRRRWRRRSGRPARRSRPLRTIRWAPRGWGSRPPSALRPRSRTPWWTPSATSA